MSQRPGGDPHWRELMMGQVDAELAKRKRSKKPHRDFRARIPLGAAGALNQAAAARGMSVSAYLRRAGLAFAAHDLGLDLGELLADEPASRTRFAGTAADREMAGQGHGLWRIRGLE